MGATRPTAEALMARLARPDLTTSLTRRAVPILTAGALIASPVLILAPGPAAAAALPDLSVVQIISGSSQNGHLFDTFKVQNKGNATASHVDLDMYTTTSSRFTDVASGGAVA